MALRLRLAHRSAVVAGAQPGGVEGSGGDDRGAVEVQHQVDGEQEQGEEDGDADEGADDA